MITLSHHTVHHGVRIAEADSHELFERRRKLFEGIRDDDRDEAWQCRSYPILAILAPAVSTSANKVEFPGDPMCLYHALSKAVSDTVSVYEGGTSPNKFYNDYCPFWDSYPTQEYRNGVSAGGIRSRSDMNESKTDGSVFDPRVWNSDVERCFKELLIQIVPKIVLVSTVSPAYRYAAQILTLVRQVLPEALTILGGRHVDATVISDDNTHLTQITESNPLADIRKGVLAPCIDVMIAGQASFALSAVLQAASLCIPVRQGIGFPDRTQLDQRLRQRLATAECRGKSTILLCGETDTTVFRVNGPPLRMADLPSPYSPFAIRAKFPVFQRSDGDVKRTAHINSGIHCPFSCDFCSESRLLQPNTAVSTSEVSYAVDEMERTIKYGARSAFFDDSIFFSGSGRRILEFCDLASKRIVPLNIGFEWGAQLTISVVEAFIDKGWHQKILGEMAVAGCSYLYFGIESLSGTIMEEISKTSRSSRQSWLNRVRSALEVVRDAGISAGASVLFGLEGETMASIEETIAGVEQLLKDGLLTIVSPNLMTYHPGTALTERHHREHRLGLEHAILGEFVRVPYSFFEEAFPGMVSRELTEEMIWHIHRETLRRWGKSRNNDVMPEVVIPDWSI